MFRSIVAWIKFLLWGNPDKLVEWERVGEYHNVFVYETRIEGIYNIMIRAIDGSKVNMIRWVDVGDLHRELEAVRSSLLSKDRV